MESIQLPDKYFYTIGEVSELTGTKPHILRYWESQFKLLRPARRYSGHRKYTQREIDLINRIRYLVIDRRFTLAGAKREINRQTGPFPKMTTPGAAPAAPAQILKEIKKDIDECLQIIRPASAQQELLAGFK